METTCQASEAAFDFHKAIQEVNERNIQRMVDEVASMPDNYANSETALERYRRLYFECREEIRSLTASNSALREVITKLKAANPTQEKP